MSIKRIALIAKKRFAILFSFHEFKVLMLLSTCWHIADALFRYNELSEIVKGSAETEHLLWCSLFQSLFWQSRWLVILSKLTYWRLHGRPLDVVVTHRIRETQLARKKKGGERESSSRSREACLWCSRFIHPWKETYRQRPENQAVEADDAPDPSNTIAGSET